MTTPKIGSSTGCKLFGVAAPLFLAAGLNSAWAAAAATTPAGAAPTAAAAAPQTPPAQPTGADLGAINTALRTLISNSDAGAKTVLDKYPTFSPLAAPGGGRGAAGGGGRGAQAGPPLPPDPSIAKLLPFKSGVGEGEYIIGPMYAPAPETKPQDDVPKGKVYQFVLDSADSKIFPATQPGRGRYSANFAGDLVPFSRHVTVYVPAQYVPGTPAPVMIAQDGFSMYGYPNLIPPTMDNLIAAHRIAPIVFVMIESGSGGNDGPERNMEYDTPSGKYSDFVEKEVLPKVAKDYNITFATDPNARGTMGGSSGGSAAFSMAWWHPELYHRVLTFSGSYTQLATNAEAPEGAWDYHAHFIPESPAKPIRIWLTASENDNGSTTSEAGHRNWLIANQHMAAAFKAKGYHYQYVYALNAKHTDGGVEKQMLPDALVWLWQDYPIPGAAGASATPKTTP